MQRRDVELTDNPSSPGPSSQQSRETQNARRKTEVRNRDVRGRMLLVYRGLLPETEGRQQSGIGIHGRSSSQSDLQTGLHGDHGTRGRHSDYVPPLRNFIRSTSGCFFPHTRSNDAESPGRRHWHSVPFHRLFCQPATAAGGKRHDRPDRQGRHV